MLKERLSDIEAHRKCRCGAGFGFDAVAGHDALVGVHPTAVARGRFE